ncbi:MAG TPA: helix-turn-helix domain-containing protein [Candidatus Binataceae bacterium]|nr:helix-turn-helix domain-containing protein [Candidatus Binataceae bacterium]
MRVSKVKAAQNRELILAAASRLFREHGIAATGVDSITGAAGLTHGGLYSQFGSKEAIAAEAIRFASARSKRRWQRIAQRSGRGLTFPAIVDGYLTPAHRDAPGQGCAVAALATEIARQPKTVRKAFTNEFKGTLEFLAKQMPGRSSSRRLESAAAAFSCMVGALILSRAVTDNALSELILNSAARRTLELAKPIRRMRRSA